MSILIRHDSQHPTQQQVLRERFYAPPRVGEEEGEFAIKDLANIVFVIIEAMLQRTGVDLRSVFDKFDQDGSGTMSHDEFYTFMESLEMSWLTRQKIRDIIRKVDRDQDGVIEWPELESAMELAISKLGVPGSSWKMYVDPAQDVMVYHNIRSVRQGGMMMMMMVMVMVRKEKEYRGRENKSFYHL